MKKKGFKLPTAYSILLIITVVIAIITQFIPGVKPARFSDVIMAPINGLNNSIDIAIFVLLIGGFLGITTKTGALDAGIASVVSKLKGKELILIPVLLTWRYKFWDVRRNNSFHSACNDYYDNSGI